MIIWLYNCILFYEVSWYSNIYIYIYIYILIARYTMYKLEAVLSQFNQGAWSVYLIKLWEVCRKIYAENITSHCLIRQDAHVVISKFYVYVYYLEGQLGRWVGITTNRSPIEWYDIKQQANYLCILTPIAKSHYFQSCIKVKPKT